MRAHRAKRAFACVSAGFLLAGGTAIGVAGTATAAAPTTTTASVPTNCSWHSGWYDSYHHWHQGYWDCHSNRNNR
ncbi:hypothetical protein [Streptomyces sp. WAC00263]|uniref:hypothetical protein n=1 Tax=Streptomyces sp. WAC00263 TaxID=1917422 RepID=UPI0015EEAFF3|nr:hypothetical protein [Streptomyces sp. WAC00263]KAF5998728.1 hypothetical protein BOG92_049980 [Streptomyces sp. WAC00263]